METNHSFALKLTVKNVGEQTYSLGEDNGEKTNHNLLEQVFLRDCLFMKKQLQKKFVN